MKITHINNKKQYILNLRPLLFLLFFFLCFYCLFFAFASFISLPLSLSLCHCHFFPFIFLPLPYASTATFRCLSSFGSPISTAIYFSFYWSTGIYLLILLLPFVLILPFQIKSWRPFVVLLKFLTFTSHLILYRDSSSRVSFARANSVLHLLWLETVLN
jgi:hypothetical protein